jgi:DNA-binding transcriptional LysR family regulator
VLEAAAGPEERDARRPCALDGIEDSGHVFVGAAGNDPHAVEAGDVARACHRGAVQPIKLDRVTRTGVDEINDGRDAGVGLDVKRAVADQGETGRARYALRSGPNGWGVGKRHDTDRAAGSTEGQTIILDVCIRHTYGMEVRDLRALLAVVRCESFTAAAKELGFSQSAVSQQVAALETELGQQLVERRPVRPTAAGQRLAEHAAHILLRLDVAQSELARYQASPSEVRIASSPLATPRLLANSLRLVRATRPELKVTVRSLDARAAVAAVASGAAHSALVDGIVGLNEPLHFADAGLMTAASVAQAPLVVALQDGHPLASSRKLDLDSLADAPWVVAPALVEERAARRHQPAPWREPMLYEGADLGTLLELVGAGLGAALLPEWACAGDERVVGVPVSRPQLVHRTELLTLRGTAPGQNPVAEALLSLASTVPQ